MNEYMHLFKNLCVHLGIPENKPNASLYAKNEPWKSLLLVGDAGLHDLEDVVNYAVKVTVAAEVWDDASYRVDRLKRGPHNLWYIEMITGNAPVTDHVASNHYDFVIVTQEDPQYLKALSRVCREGAKVAVVHHESRDWSEALNNSGLQSLLYYPIVGYQIGTMRKDAAR